VPSELDLQVDIYKNFAEYFNDPQIPQLKYYITNTLKGLKDGHICTLVKDEDIDKIKQSTHVSHREPWDNKPFILMENRFYFQRYFSYETMVVQKVSRFLECGKSSLDDEIEKLNHHKEVVEKLFSDDQKSDEPNWQNIAILNSVLHRFSIITGGPGTGKTTTVAKVLSLIFTIKSDSEVVLVAQTGKATIRLKESLLLAKQKLDIDEETKCLFDKILPSTIHRLLGNQFDSVDFKHNKNKPLKYDTIIIDEASMIDVPLMAKLLDAISDQTKVILLGDKNQLASIEAGSVFADLCDASQMQNNLFPSHLIECFNQYLNTKIPQTFIHEKLSELHIVITELQKSFRFNDNEGIGLLSKNILKGRILSPEELNRDSNKNIQLKSSIDCIEFTQAVSLFESYIKSNDPLKCLDLFNKIKVLCATHNGPHGVIAINQLIENHLHSKNLIDHSIQFYDKRPILITQNDYHSNLYNGDTGICIKEKTGETNIYFKDENNESGVRALSPHSLGKHNTVYAMTIHKSQGSEFDQVVVVLPTKHSSEHLSRELIYTAVTRAKNEVLLIGDSDTFKRGVSNKVTRASGISNRF